MNQHRPSRRRVVATGLAMAGLLAAPALARPAARVRRIGGPAFGTQWYLTIRAEADAQALAAAIEQILTRIDRLMSPWLGDSAISVFNRRQRTDWMTTDGEVIDVVRAALEIRSLSGGAFDPRVGPLVARWGFGPIEAGDPLSHSRFGLANDAIRKSHPALTLDLCGIAKGYALDLVVRALLDRGERDFVVDLGGEIGARGLHPDRRRWQIAVEDPRPGLAQAAEVVALGDNAIATSGDKVNGYTLNGRRYSHIIDPRKAAPVATATASVSVIAESGMLADAWATALMAAGADAPALAERNQIDALFLLRNGDGLQRIAVGRFDDHLA